MLSDQQHALLKVLANKREDLAETVDSEDYALTLFDLQLLLLPSFNFLEAIEYNEISKEETEKRFSFLKRTDMSLDFSKLVI